MLLFVGNVSWVMVKNFLAQRGRVDVCIYFGSADTFVPKHSLNGTQVGSALEQSRGKRVSQRMRRYCFLYSCISCVVLYHYQNHEVVSRIEDFLKSN